MEEPDFFSWNWLLPMNKALPWRKGLVSIYSYHVLVKKISIQYGFNSHKRPRLVSNHWPKLDRSWHFSDRLWEIRLYSLFTLHKVKILCFCTILEMYTEQSRNWKCFRENNKENIKWNRSQEYECCRIAFFDRVCVNGIVRVSTILITCLQKRYFSKNKYVRPILALYVASGCSDPVLRDFLDWNWTPWCWTFSYNWL